MNNTKLIKEIFGYAVITFTTICFLAIGVMISLNNNTYTKTAGAKEPSPNISAVMERMTKESISSRAFKSHSLPR
jgi:hypothetical protein